MSYFSSIETNVTRRILEQLVLAAPLLGATLLTGCGGSSRVSSGVDSEKQGKDLSTEEIQAVCEATIEYRNQQLDGVEATCRIRGVVAGAVVALSGSSDRLIQEGCSEAYDECKAETQSSATSPEAACAGAPKSAPTCTATVAEVERCLTAQIDMVQSSLEKIPSCDELTQSSAARAANEASATSDVCSSVQRTCPEALLLSTL